MPCDCAVIASPGVAPERPREFEDELYETMYALGDRPEDLPREEDQRAYQAWLNKHRPPSGAVGNYSTFKAFKNDSSTA